MNLFSSLRFFRAGNTPPEAALECFSWAHATGDWDAAIAARNPETQKLAKDWYGDKATFGARARAEFPLSPSTEYSVVLSMPANSAVAAALLFTPSSAYTTPAGWSMKATSSGNPSAFGEYLVMAVDASAVPEPDAAALWLCALVILAGRRLF